MSTRISSLAALILLAGCDRAELPATDSVQVAQREENHIACARGDAPLRRDCTIEQARSDDGLILTVRHPDGGFRRLHVTRDGRGVVPADGAQPAAVTIAGAGEIDVAIAGERYRLPATVKAPS